VEADREDASTYPIVYSDVKNSDDKDGEEDGDEDGDEDGEENGEENDETADRIKHYHHQSLYILYL